MYVVSNTSQNPHILTHCLIRKVANILPLPNLNIQGQAPPTELSHDMQGSLFTHFLAFCKNRCTCDAFKLEFPTVHALLVALPVHRPQLLPFWQVLGLGVGGAWFCVWPGNVHLWACCCGSCTRKCGLAGPVASAGPTTPV